MRLAQFIAVLVILGVVNVCFGADNGAAKGQKDVLHNSEANTSGLSAKSISASEVVIKGNDSPILEAQRRGFSSSSSSSGGKKKKKKKKHSSSSSSSSSAFPKKKKKHSSSSSSSSSGK